MSSAPLFGGTPAPQRYFCHQCEANVTVVPSSPDADVTCPLCHGGFVEELESPNPNTNPHPFFSFPSSDSFFLSSSSSPSPFPFLFSSPSPSAASFDLRQPSDVSVIFGSDQSPFRSVAVSGGGAPFNPMTFLQDHFHQLLSGGANIQVVLEGGPIMAGGGSLGDYFIGPGLEQLIQQLAENDPNRYGTPPASKSAVNALPDIKISEELLASDEAQCAVCKDTFEIGVEAKQMPCKHIYHKDCILPWLELHSSCPVCRYELPTDDPDNEQRRSGVPAAPASGAAAAGAGNSDSSAGSSPGASRDGNSPGPRMVERRFRISLPWPFRAFGSQAEPSNVRGGGQSDGGRSGGADGNSGGQTETRQEDLD
ncbi:E3 ubiquitin-protein ligase RING1-like [Typha latifolia]|uniref:E3 ubiquitin-protein ligase RING1-like n=1 Tax=Typha latifolia TaxID=4733 RepID=UPI003C2B66CA